jgi:beta-glucosidase
MQWRLEWFLSCAMAFAAVIAALPDTLVARTQVASSVSNASTVHPQAWPVLPRAAYRDTDVEARVERLLAAMSIEAKVGQVIQADIDTVTPAEVRQYQLGSVLNGGNSGPGGRDLAPAPEWLALADAFYDASMSAGTPQIPLLWGTDAVHGHNNIIGATIFPHNIALGATHDPQLVRRIGETTAREVRVTGQDWTFAPTLAVARDVRWGRSYESYSEDPAIVRSYAAAMVIGLQGSPGSDTFLRGEHVLATAKHFLGDGGTVEGRDQGDNRSSERALREIHGAGYLSAIPAGVQSIMASYSSWHGVKMHGHEGLLTRVLKQRLGFEGFVVGDWNGHGQVPGCTNVSCAQAFNAGIDMFMAPDSWKGLQASLLAQVRSGEIPSERLDDAVRRILRVKVRAGLFEAGRPSKRPLAGHYEVLGSPEHREVARQAVRESLVLLKNDHRLLPLRRGQRVLVAGSGASDVSKQCGGWTLTWQGTGVEPSDFPGATTIFEGIRDVVMAGGGTAMLSADASFTQRPDVAIVVYGEDPYAEFQGDIATLEYKPGDKRDLALLKRLRDAGVPVVSVFLSGRPLWVNPEINASNAFVAAWLPGSEGGGIADVLFRTTDGSVAYDFKGKLSFSWPRAPLQAANKDAAGGLPQFPLGFGLTYADRGDLAPLAEDVPRESPSTVDARTFYSDGKLGRGWRWVVKEGEGGLEDLGPLPWRGQSLEVVPDERQAADDVRTLNWTANGRASFGLLGRAPIDLQRESNGELSLAIEYRVNAPPAGDVSLALQCGEKCGAALPVTGELAKAPVGEWRKLRILLNCFERAGAGMQKITVPFMISSTGTFGLSIASIRLEAGVENTVRCSQ